MRIARFLALAQALALAAALPAQGFEFLPGASYDASVPTLRAVAGHEFGERITSHAESARYLQALAAGSRRAALVRYGETWEGRALWYLVIGSEANVARLQAIKQGMQALADPRDLADERAQALIADLPAVVWLAYAVHGNEISGTDAGLLTAYHLLAAERDAVAEAARERCVVVIDPLQNPDGRDRFVHYFEQTRGRWPDADSQAAEHNEAWPGGRTNHYLFDMNRDWFALTQPETRGRVAAFLEWYPLVYVDLHEMGSNSSYYFAPPAQPFNPELTDDQHRWLEAFGRNNAAWFDRFGFDYFTRETFDSFYPGYGEGWPMFHGAIGMTYEQASVRGLVVKRDDEVTMHYRDSVQRHFAASLATIETAARDRDGLLRSFLAYRRGAVRRGREAEAKEYVLPPGRDPDRVRKLVRLLLAQGIEVRRADAAFTHPRVQPLLGGEAQERVFPVGTFVASRAQPAGRLLETLFARHQDMGEKFIAEQERLRRKRLGTEIYDVTAWSLPLLFDVECWAGLHATESGLTPLREAPGRDGRAPDRAAAVAYLVPWGSAAAARALAAMLREDLRVHAADKAFALAGRDFPAGSLLVKAKGNPPDLLARLQRIAADSGVEVVGTDTAWVDAGIGFGSDRVRFLKKPRIALAWGEGTNSSSAGWARYLLEQEYGLSVTAVHARALGRAELDRYNVVVLPSGAYGAALGAAAERLQEWVSTGGTLVALGEASLWLAAE